MAIALLPCCTELTCDPLVAPVKYFGCQVSRRSQGTAPASSRVSRTTACSRVSPISQNPAGSADGMLTMKTNLAKPCALTDSA